MVQETVKSFKKVYSLHDNQTLIWPNENEIIHEMSRLSGLGGIKVNCLTRFCKIHDKADTWGQIQL